MKRWAIGSAVVLASMAAAAPGRAALKPGDKAPPMTIAKWFKGAPVEKFAPGKVYVVEFWATWCGPCRVTIPHLTELAKKYAGKVTFAGISVWERDPAYLEKVGKFVTDMGDKMDYSVGADTADGDMAKAWMTAAGENGIPAAFVVDGNGKIAWIGHPMSDLGPTLDRVVAGTWNVSTYAAKRAKEKAGEEARMRVTSKLNPLLRASKFAEALKELDAAMKRGEGSEADFGFMRFNLLARTNEAKAYPYALKLATGSLKGNATALNQLAWSIVMDGSPFKKPDYKVGIEIAKLAAQASKNADPDILDTLGLAYYKGAKKAEAVATQRKAVDLAVRMKRPADQLKEMRARLEQFRAGK